MMDCVVVKHITSDARKPETKAVLSKIGNRFGRLVVERRNALGYVVMRCDCGETISLTTGRLMDGSHYQCESCERFSKKSLVRQYLGDRIYNNVNKRGYSARARCENPKHHNFKNYGAIGITFDYEDIEHYSLHVGILCKSYGLGNQVDRADNSVGYSPENVRLVSRKENNRNRRITTTINGFSLAEIAESNGMNPQCPRYDSFRSRIRNILSTREPSMEEVVALVHHFNERNHNPNLSRKSPARKILISGVPLPEFLSRMGFKGNRRIYECAKGHLRRHPNITAEELRDRITVYAIQKDIRGQRAA